MFLFLRHHRSVLVSAPWVLRHSHDPVSKKAWEMSICLGSGGKSVSRQAQVLFYPEEWHGYVQMTLITWKEEHDDMPLSCMKEAVRVISFLAPIPAIT